MSDFNVGDRVAYERRGDDRVGTVEETSAYIPYVYVKPDLGFAHWIRTDKLTRVTPATLVSAAQAVQE